MNEINDITRSMGLTLKPVKCKSNSIPGGKAEAWTFAIGDVVLESLNDAPEKFLRSNITFKGKSKEIHDIFQLEGTIENIHKCMIWDEFKLKVLYSVCHPISEICTCWLSMNSADTQLEKLDHFHTNTIKAMLGLPSKGQPQLWSIAQTGLIFLPLACIWNHIHWLMPNAWLKPIVV